MIETSDLEQRFDGHQVLKKVDLKIEKGKVFGLIGPTGAGKTTLLRILDLLDRPVAGRIYFDGEDVLLSERRRFEIRRRMSFVQQKPVVFSMSVFDNVACGLRWRHDKKENIDRKVRDTLKRVGLSGLGLRDARTLSGGEVQRVAVARALVTEPELLLLDEPTANLDPVSIYRIETTLLQVVGEGKTTVLLATHGMSQVQRLADTIGVLMKGELLQVGSPAEVFCSPVSGEVAGFVGIGNILSGEIAAKDGDLAIVEVNGNSIQVVTEVPVGKKIDLVIGPENITFALTRDPSSARNVFRGRITVMTELGTLVRIKVDCGFPLFGVLTVKSARELGFEIGKSIFANFKATAVHIIQRS